MTSASEPVDWDAQAYHRVSDMQLAGGKRFLDGLELAGDEVVLDAGCGTGRVTKLLVERIPRGRVIAVDASPSMVEIARETLGESADVRGADLTALDLGEPVDFVFSTSVFHWILDHEALFASLHGELRPGGRLAAHFGGAGNVSELRSSIRSPARRAPFAEYLRGYEHPWLFATPEETRARLQTAGFDVVRCDAEVKTLRLEEPREWHRTVGVPVQLARLPEELREPYLEAVLEQLPDPGKMRFVRLNVEARKPER